MSWEHALWSPERRAWAAERLRKRNSDPELTAKRTAWMHDPARKGELRQRGRHMSDVRSNDVEVNAIWRAGCIRAANQPAKRKRSRDVMKELMKRPEMIIQASINGKSIDHSANSRKGWLTRRRNKITANIALRKKSERRVSL